VTLSQQHRQAFTNGRCIGSRRVLFGLDEFSVLEVRRVDASAVKVIIEQAAREGPCPECGVFIGTVKDPLSTVRSRPMTGPLRGTATLVAAFVERRTRSF
jgi:hypothetical protein